MHWGINSTSTRLRQTPRKCAEFSGFFKKNETCSNNVEDSVVKLVRSKLWDAN
jgi:hypothetical protein